MKVVTLLAAVITLSLAGGQAQAAKATKKKAAKTAAKKTSNQEAAQLPAKVEPAAPAAPAAAVEPAQTSAAPVATAVSEAAPKRWSFLLDYWVEGQVNGVNRSNSGGTAAGSEAMVATPQAKVTYKITDTASAAAGIDWEQTFGSKDGTDSGQWTMSDAFVMVAHSKLATLGPVNVRGYLRPYLPTSEASQNPNSGRYFALRGNISAKAPIGGGFSLAYTLEPRYFAAKNASYKTYKSDGSVKEWKATEDYRVRHWLGLDYENGKFTGYTNWGVKSQFYNQDSDNGQNLSAPQKDQLYSETAVGYQIIDNFAMNVGYYTETNNFRDNNGWVMFNDKEYLYFVEGVVTF